MKKKIIKIPVKDSVTNYRLVETQRLFLRRLKTTNKVARVLERCINPILKDDLNEFRVLMSLYVLFLRVISD